MSIDSWTVGVKAAQFAIERLTGAGSLSPGHHPGSVRLHA
jgi:hypothetical protein